MALFTVAVFFLSFGIVNSRITLSPQEQSCYEGYPNVYYANSLVDGETITVDGDLSEGAWEKARWSEDFVDIQGNLAPKPYHKTRVKMLWDANFLYVGAYLEDNACWANMTEDQTVVFQDNDFEVFIDPSGDNVFYKEFEVNARGISWNLLLLRAYLNGGPAVCNTTESQPDICAHSAKEFGVDWWNMRPGVKVATKVYGDLDNPKVRCKGWTVEIALPLEQLARYENIPGDGPQNLRAARYPVKVSDMWRINFSRVQWHVEKGTRSDGTEYYFKTPGRREENWVWQPMGVVNMHLPERWGYVVFWKDLPIPPIENEHAERQPIESEVVGAIARGENAVIDETFPMRRVLLDVYRSEYTYKALYGTGFIGNLDGLVSQTGLKDDYLGGWCGLRRPEVRVEGDGFVVTVTSDDGLVVGHINATRYLWFSEYP